jgi:transposase-like protein
LPGANRIDDAKRQAIVAAVRGGERRSRVARRFGVSGTSVTNLARAAGLADPPLSAARRAAIRATTQLNQDLAKAKRARQALALMGVAERLRRQMFQPSVVYAFGRGADGTHQYTEHAVPEPDAKAKQALAIALGITLQRALELARYDRDDDSGATVKAAVIDLVERLAAEPLGEEDVRAAS